jgi:hypothetical protein
LFYDLVSAGSGLNFSTCYCASCPTRPDYGTTGKRSLVRELPKKGTCGSSVPCGGSGGAVGWDSSALETRPMFVHAGCAASALCAAKRCLPRRRHEGPIVPSHCRSFLCLRQSNFARRRRAESLKNSVVPSEIREFQRARQSFSLLAQNKDWLAENFDKLIRVQDMLPQDDIVERNVDRKAVAETKEHISSMPRGGPHYEVEHHPHRPPTGALRS